jgi:hypothetical protein
MREKQDPKCVLRDNAAYDRVRRGVIELKRIDLDWDLVTRYVQTYCAAIVGRADKKFWLVSHLRNSIHAACNWLSPIFD